MRERSWKEQPGRLPSAVPRWAAVLGLFPEPSDSSPGARALLPPPLRSSRRHVQGRPCSLGPGEPDPEAMINAPERGRADYPGGAGGLLGVPSVLRPSGRPGAAQNSHCCSTASFTCFLEHLLEGAGLLPALRLRGSESEMKLRQEDLSSEGLGGQRREAGAAVCSWPTGLPAAQTQDRGLDAGTALGGGPGSRSGCIVPTTGRGAGVLSAALP